MYTHTHTHTHTHTQKQGRFVSGLLVCIAGGIDGGCCVLCLSLCLLCQEETTEPPLSQDGTKEKVVLRKRGGGGERKREREREREKRIQ